MSSGFYASVFDYIAIFIFKDAKIAVWDWDEFIILLTGKEGYPLVYPFKGNVVTSRLLNTLL
jgi:hypothetical protein